MPIKNINNLIKPPSLNLKDFSKLLKNSTEGLQKHYLIIAGWESGIFEYTIAPKTFQEIAQKLGYHEIMTKLFCEALVKIDLLTKKGTNYVNSSLTNNYLVKSSSLYMPKTLEFMKNNARLWAQLPAIIKNGPVTKDIKAEFGDGRLIRIAEKGEAGGVFKIIDLVKNHVNIQRWRKMIDVGGGHGLHAIAFADLNPKLEVFVFEQSHIVPITSKYIEAYKSERVHVISGDFYKESIGQGYDAIFSSINQTCSDPKFIRIFVDSLNPEGDLILRRFKENSDVNPLKILDWNLVCYEGRKIGRQPYSCARATKPLPRDKYIKQMESSDLTLHAIASVDSISEIIFAKKSK